MKLICSISQFCVFLTGKWRCFLSPSMILFVGGMPQYLFLFDFATVGFRIPGMKNRKFHILNA